MNLTDFYGPDAPADSVAYPTDTPGTDYHQGHGHVRVSNLFPLDKSFNTFLFEGEIVTTDDESYVTMSAIYAQTSGGVFAAPTRDLTVTLAWSDPAGPLYCGHFYAHCLVHLLGTTVHLNKYNAGTGESSQTVYYSNFGVGDTVSDSWGYTAISLTSKLL